MMKDNKTVTINDKTYDAITGLPVIKNKPYDNKPSYVNNSKIKNIQSFSQKSKGFYNRASKPLSDIKAPLKKAKRDLGITINKNVSHFGPKIKLLSTKPGDAIKRMDVSPIKHPLVKKGEKTQQNIKSKLQESSTEKSSKQIKKEAITEALKKASDASANNKKTTKRHLKYINVFSICIAIILIAGYLIYMYMPSFSVRIASAQAGINASYPQYHLDGYSLDGPISYSEGEVIIKFHANTGDREYVIKQSKSSWDSSAVREKVNKDSKGEYIITPTEVHGLSIYTYNSGNAAWVNGGILYTITGNAKLSNDQIRRIAASL